MFGRRKLIGIWLIIGVLFPAILSFVIYKALATSHGVLLTSDQGAWYKDSFQSALRDLPQTEKSEISAYVWNLHSETLLFVAKGKPSCALLIDQKPVLEKNGPATAATIAQVPAGFSEWKLRIERTSGKDSLIFRWSRDFETPKELPANRSFTKIISESTIWIDRCGRRLGILARLNVVLILLWGLFRVLRIRIVPETSGRTMRWVLFALLIVLLWIRAAGAGYQVNEGIHPDEKMYGVMIEQIRGGSLAPTQFWYTTGYFFITVASQHVAEWVLAEDLPQNAIQRGVSVVASWLSCLIVFWIGTLLISERAGLLAMILFGFSFMPVELAHFGIVEPTMVFFFLLAFLCLIRALEEPTWKRFAIAGLVAGVAVAVKQTAGAIVIPFAVAIGLLLKQKKIVTTEVVTTSAAWMASAALGFFLLSPATILDFSRFYHYQILQTHSLSGETHAHFFFVGNESSFGELVLRGLISGAGIPLLIAAAIGMILIWRKSPKAGWVLVPVTLAYLLVVCRIPILPEHYVLILCPLIALLAAAAVVSIPASPAIAIFIAFLFLIPSLKEIFILQEALHGKDTRRQAAEWCYKNLPAGSRIDYEMFGPRFLIPMFDAKRVVLFKRPSWEQHVQQKESEYYVEDSITRDVFFDAPAHFPNEMHWFEQWQQNADAVQEFHGRKYRLFNPDIKIYRLRTRNGAPSSPPTLGGAGLKPALSA